MNMAHKKARQRVAIRLTDESEQVCMHAERRKYDVDRFRRHYDSDPLSGRYDPDPFLRITFGIGFLLKLLVAGCIISFVSISIQNPTFFDRVLSMINLPLKK